MNTFDGMKNNVLEIVKNEKRTLINIAKLLIPYQHFLEEDYQIILKEISSVGVGFNELMSLTAAFHERATIDPIGLYSKAYLNENLEILDKKFNLAFLIGDLNEFKIYNDKYGHIQGDVALNVIANKFKDSIENRLIESENAFVARYGGEELCAFISNYDRNEQDLLQLADGARTEIERLEINGIPGINLPDERYRYRTITIAAGIRIKSESIREFMHNVDYLLTKKDKEGRNRVYLRKN